MIFFRPAFARRSVKPNDEPCPRLRAGGKPVPTPHQVRGRLFWDHARGERRTWRMPPLHELAPAQLTLQHRLWLMVLRAYLVIAAGLVLARIVMLAVGGG